MPVHLLPSLLLSILALGYSPGPANIYSLSCALRHGRIKSMRMWFGLLTGFTIGAVITATSAHYLGMALGKYTVYIKYIGASYLVYLAYKTLRNLSVAENEDTSCTFFSGMIVQLTNAKMLLYELTVYSTFVLPYSNRLVDLYAAAAWLLLAGPGANLVWLIAGSAFEPIFNSHKKTVGVIMAAAIFACAVAIAIY